MKAARIKRAGRYFFGALVLAVAVIGCDYMEKGRIERLCKQAQESLQKGDAAGYLAFLAPEYRDDYLPVDQAREKLSARLQQDPRPQLSFGKREIQLTGDKAVVSEWFTLEANVDGRLRRYEEVQHLLLERRAQGWLCLSGSKVLALLGGRMEQENEIERTMLRRESALVKKDINAYMILISPDYLHEGKGPDQIKDKLLQIFRIYDHIDFRSFDRKIYYMGAIATVQQKFNMTAERMGKPITINSEERFELVKTDDGWKITKGFK
jgi:ketosteroid isomerase-like protein